MTSFRSLLALLIASLAADAVHGQENTAILSSGFPLPCSKLASFEELCSVLSQRVVDGVPVGKVSVEGLVIGCKTTCSDLELAGQQCGDPGKENAGRDKLRLCE